MTYFVPVSLPKWEIRLSWIVWIFHSFGAFYIAYLVSHGPVEQWIQHWLTKSDFFPGFQVDISDPEWFVYRKGVFYMIFDFALHSLGMFVLTKLLSGDLLKYSLICLGVALHIHMTSIQCILILTLFCIFVTTVTVVTRSHATAWVICILFVVKSANYLPFTPGEHVFYREFNVYLYGALRILNFSLHLCNNKEIRYKDIFVDHLLYMAYLPYAMSLIVLFPDFKNQLETKILNGANLPGRSTIFFCLRLIFWFMFYELLLHFIHVNSLFNSPFTVIEGLDNYELASIAYVAGQLFHVKYVIIFGLPSLFAYIDGMVPPPPPICISRVSRYSRMWRHFDYGLHQFLKHQVYLPLMRPTLSPVLSVLRGLATLVAVFGVVIAWHGAQWHHICWVSLSALELVIEKIGKHIWSTEQFQQLRRKIGEVNTRRLIALGMLATVIPGIFGVFFFLGQEGIGATIFDRIISQGFWDIVSLNITIDRFNSGFVLLQLLVLGYFYNNVCIELDIKKTIKND